MRIKTGIGVFYLMKKKDFYHSKLFGFPDILMVTQIRKVIKLRQITQSASILFIFIYDYYIVHKEKTNISDRFDLVAIILHFHIMDLSKLMIF